MQPCPNLRLVRHALFLAISSAALAQVTELAAPVIGIQDSETIRVLHEDVSQRIRLCGIDCPEMGRLSGPGQKQLDRLPSTVNL